MKNFKVLADNVDVGRIVRQIEEKNLWQVKSLRTHEMMQQEEIILQYNNLDDMLAGTCDYKETVAYPPMYELTEARDFIFALMLMVKGERLGRVFITKLGAGKKIAPHTDVDAGFPADYFQRFHLCLKDNKQTQFICGGEFFRPKPGTLFTFNNLLRHEVKNEGKTERWTMIIDIKKPTLYTPKDTLGNILEKANAKVVTQ